MTAGSSGESVAGVGSRVPRQSDAGEPTEREVIFDLLALVADLIDDGDCRYDHHGYCQEHPTHEPPCPHGRAKVWLAQWEFDGFGPSAVCFCGEDHLTGWCLRDADAGLPPGFPIFGAAP